MLDASISNEQYDVDDVSTQLGSEGRYLQLSGKESAFGAYERGCFR